MFSPAEVMLRKLNCPVSDTKYRVSLLDPAFVRKQNSPSLVKMFRKPPRPGTAPIR